MTMSVSVIHAFAPTGTLRASINLGNPVLARRDPATQEAVGLSVDMARALGLEPLDLAPQSHVHFDTRVHWVCLNDGLPVEPD